jgi:hypothetical protein
MQPTITLIPYGGLANRMKAIESVLHLIDNTSLQATAIWFKDNGLNCRFDDLFCPIKTDRFKLREAAASDYLLYDRPRKKNAYLPAVFQQMQFDGRLRDDEVTQLLYKQFDFRQWALSHRKSYISACVLFYENHRRKLFDAFVPLPALQARIDHICESFTSHTVGIHIRRTDNVEAINGSPTELFVQRMREELQLYPETKFYVASDSRLEKNRMITAFGDRIIVLSDVDTSRNSVRGMQDALVELYVLSRTNKIFGSHQSSYSETAAQIGNIPYEKIFRK